MAGCRAGRVGAGENAVRRPDSYPENACSTPRLVAAACAGRDTVGGHQPFGDDPDQPARSCSCSARRSSSAHRTVAEIAHQSGFGSVSTFNAVFRDEFGMSPRQARVIDERR
ncbi:helix-turn-helix domain-containing protein [Rhodococcus sp. 1168]|uniref:helix-turn-helix domain-containing protein n=1 Tax=Rhodococcus sp. 1168 TaxID=2018041 RepID=UPI001C38E243